VIRHESKTHNQPAVNLAREVLGTWPHACALRENVPLQANTPFAGWSGNANAKSPRDQGAPSRRADDVLVVVLREALRHDEPEENIDTWHDDDDQDGDGLVDLPAARAICAARDVVDVREQ